MVPYKKYRLQTGRKILKNHDVKTHLESRGTFTANDKAKLSLQTGSRDGRLTDCQADRERQEERRAEEEEECLGG